MLCSDEIFWGKIVSGNLPPRHLTTLKYPGVWNALDHNGGKTERCAR